MKTILVVEDDDVVRLLLESTFKLVGFHVMAARNGAEAVKTYSEYCDEISAVFLDVNLPILSGQQAFLEMRAVSSKVPIIVMSGIYNRKELDEMHGMAAFLQKPFRLSAVIEVLDFLIGIDEESGRISSLRHAKPDFIHRQASGFEGR